MVEIVCFASIPRERQHHAQLCVGERRFAVRLEYLPGNISGLRNPRDDDVCIGNHFPFAQGEGWLRVPRAASPGPGLIEERFQSVTTWWQALDDVAPVAISRDGNRCRIGMNQRRESRVAAPMLRQREETDG